MSSAKRALSILTGAFAAGLVTSALVLPVSCRQTGMSSPAPRAGEPRSAAESAPTAAAPAAAAPRTGPRVVSPPGGASLEGTAPPDRGTRVPAPAPEAAGTTGAKAAAAAPAAARPVFHRRADDWPMWGGSPSRNMVNSAAEGIPSQWDIESGRNILWKAGLGSQSYGNPVVAQGKVLVGTNNDRERNPAIKGDKGVIMCFDAASGKFLWQIVHDKLSAGRVNDWPEQGICSTPAAEDGRFWYVSNRCQLVCADLDGMADGNDGPYRDEKYKSPIDGDVIWLLDMYEDLGVFPHNLATSSPLVVNDLVYVVTSNGVEKDHLTIPSPRSPSFIAVNKRTGELVWESNEPGEHILHGQWSCPCYGVAGGRPQVVFPGGDGWLYSLEPSSGKVIWKFDCNPKDSKWELGGLGTRNNLIATPVFVDGVVYIAVGQDPEHGEGAGHLYAIAADGTGDVTESKRIWHFGEKDFRRTISTVAVHEGLLYAADLSGFLQVLDAATGKPYAIYDTLAAVWGSPTVIDGKVFLGDEDGDVFIARAGKKLEKISEINMNNSVYTTPVVAGGVLYISNRTSLYAIAARN